jgi:O-antigen ligase
MTSAATNWPDLSIQSTALSPASRISRFQSSAAFALLVLTIVGFPIAALSETFAGTGTQSLTVPYRVLIIFISLAVVATVPFARVRGKFDSWLSLFLALYLGRLIYDSQTNYIAGNSFALQFYIGVVLVPLAAIAIGGVDRFSDHLLARYIMIGAGTVVFLASLGQALGLAYNPWEQYGQTNIRLGFEALNPISLGQVAASAILASIIVLINRTSNLLWRISALLIIIISSILLIQAGSRGALVSIAAALLWFGLTKAKRAAFIAPLLFVVFTFGLAQTDLLNKITSLQDGGIYTDASAVSRLDSQKVAIDDFLDAPLIGKHYANPGLEEGEYPHNILIETAMALGVIGLLLWGIMLFRAAKNMISSLSVLRPMLCILFVQKFVGGMLSGSIWASDATFILLMITLTIVGKQRSDIKYAK